MTCIRCHGAAVVSSAMPGAPDIQTHVCASCGARWSALDCDTRGCRERAVARCKVSDCQKFRCKGHGPGRSGVCLACTKRTARVMQPSRTRWTRTGELHQ